MPTHYSEKPDTADSVKKGELWRIYSNDRHAATR